MNVAYSPADLSADARAVAIGTFDGVHLGHKRVIDAALAAGPMPTVVTFDPHPRVVLGNQVELLTRSSVGSSSSRRSVSPTRWWSSSRRTQPGSSRRNSSTPSCARSATEVLVAGENFRFGRARSGDLDLLAMLGFDVRPVPLVEHVSSTSSGTCCAPERSSARPRCSDGRRSSTAPW